MHPTNSKLWNVFEKITSTQARCNICRKILSYKSTTTNLKTHLKRAHKLELNDAIDGLKSTPDGSKSDVQDLREGLKEYVTIDLGRSEAAAEVVVSDEDTARADATDWEPPAKSARKSKSAATKKVVRKEVIHSNGVEYEVFTHDPLPQQSTSSATRIPPIFTSQQSIEAEIIQALWSEDCEVTYEGPKFMISTSDVERVKGIFNQHGMSFAVRNSEGHGLVVSDTPILRVSSSQPQVEENQYSAFAKFLSLRIQSLKSPYWQSCAINEVTSALHRVEMLCFEPRVECVGAQTDPVEVRSISDAQPSSTDSQSINKSPQVIELEILEGGTAS